MATADKGTQVTLRIALRDRASLARIARRFDRTLSGEIRRAIRYYVTHFATADRALRREIEGGEKRGQ